MKLRKVLITQGNRNHNRKPLIRDPLTYPFFIHVALQCHKQRTKISWHCPCDCIHFPPKISFFQSFGTTMPQTDANYVIFSWTTLSLQYVKKCFFLYEHLQRISVVKISISVIFINQCNLYNYLKYIKDDVTLNLCLYYVNDMDCDWIWILKKCSGSRTKTMHLTKK